MSSALEWCYQMNAYIQMAMSQLTNLGLTPRFNEPGPNVGGLGTSVTRSFNDAYEAMLNTHSGVDLIRVNSFAFFNPGIQSSALRPHQCDRSMLHRG